MLRLFPWVHSGEFLYFNPSLLNAYAYTLGSGAPTDIRTKMLRHISSRTFSSTKSTPHIPIVFLRHGQSTWNKSNRFIGMNDTPLTADGELEAIQAGHLLNMHGEYANNFDCVFTSLLKRSTHTVWLALKQMGLEHLPVEKTFYLNERSYGDLVGRNKKELVELYGKEQVRAWRRSWDTPPPPMSKDSPYWPYKDPRYAKLGIREEDIPYSESLKDVTKRTSKFWDNSITPLLKQGKRLLLVGHENNLRSIIKRLGGCHVKCRSLSFLFISSIPSLTHIPPTSSKHTRQHIQRRHPAHRAAPRHPVSLPPRPGHSHAFAVRRRRGRYVWEILNQPRGAQKSCREGSQHRLW